MQGELPRIGAELGGYRLESVVSRGGMAVVYLAHDLRLGRKVALKILAPDLAEDDNFRERFLRESRTAASIDHPNVIPIFDAGEADGLLYIAMRHVEEADLRALLRAEGKLEPARAVSIATQVAGALGAAHRLDLVHRDVKPANILLIPRDRDGGVDHAYLSDFGLAKHASSISGLTRTGHFVGTLNYAAPEQVEGKPIDGRTDIYALGCVLFECVTGQPPFVREEGVAVVMAHVNDPPPLVTDLRPEAPAALARIVDKMLAKAPADRHSTCEELIRELRPAAGVPDSISRTRSAAAAVPSAPASEAEAAPAPSEAPAAPESEAAAEAGPPGGLPAAIRGVPGGLRTLAALGVAALAAVAIVLLAGDDDAADRPTPGTDVAARSAGATWRALDDAPTARQQAGGAVVDGKLWVVGGLEGEEAAAATASVEVFDPATGTWSAGPELPEPVHHAVARNYRGELVVIGGWLPEGSDLTAEESGRAYVLRGGDWEALPPLNHPRAAAAAAVIGDRLIVTGGQADGELVPETEVFDGRRWRDVAPIPTPREHLAAASDRRYLYALGGRELSSDRNLGVLERYDPEADRWTELPEMPTPRGSFDAVLADGHLVAAGGETPTEVLGEVESFDLETERWSSLPALSVPRHGLTLAVDRTTVYAVGGALEAGHASSTATVESLDFGGAFATPPPTGQWRALADAPTSRQQAAPAVFGGRLWLLGGLTGADGKPTATTEFYDPAIDTWNAGPKLPLELHHATAVTYDGELVLIGGWIAEGSDLTAETSGRVFALRDGEWVELPELGHPRAAAGAAVVGDELVVTGGQEDGELVPETEVFDGESWSDAAPIPTPREHLAVATDGTHVYAAGGRELSADRNLAVLERYDPASDQWTGLPDIPAPAGGFAGAVVGDYLAVVGGEDALEVIDEVWAFDLEANAWSELPRLIESRHGQAVLGLGSTLYALGGAVEPGHTRSTATAEALDFD